MAEDMRDAGLAILSRIDYSQFLFGNHQLPSSLSNYAKPISSHSGLFRTFIYYSAGDTHTSPCLSMHILLYVYVHTVCYIALAWCFAALSACDLFALSYRPAALAGYLSITFVEVRSLSGYFASLVIVVKATSVGELSHLNVYLSVLIVIFSILCNDKHFLSLISAFLTSSLERFVPNAPI